MVKIPLTPWIVLAEKHFNKKPTFEMARNIWLYCQSANSEVPKRVMIFFVDKLQSDNEMWLDKIGSTLEREQNSGMLDLLIIQMKESGMTFAEIAHAINENFDDVKYSDDAIGIRYRRATK